MAGASTTIQCWAFITHGSGSWSTHHSHPASLLRSACAAGLGEEFQQPNDPPSSITFALKPSIAFASASEPISD